MMLNKITPFLWFKDNAEEAMNFYVGIFKNSKVLRVVHYGDAGPGKKGSAMSCIFQLEGQTFYALNGGVYFKFTPAISFFVSCDTQKEIDALWKKLLTSGGKTMACGWLTDQFGVTWQIVPSRLGGMMNDSVDPVKYARVMKAMMQMVKLDIKKLERAFKAA